MSDVQVEVSGGDTQTREVVTAVIVEALTDKGFGNTTEVDNIGEPTATESSAALLAIAHAETPEIFDTPITVRFIDDIPDAVFEEGVEAMAEAYGH